MSDRDSEFNFVRGIHVRTDIRIDISTSITPMTTELGKQLHLEELHQEQLHQDHLTLKRCYNFFSARAMILKFDQNDYEETLIRLKLS